MTILRKGILASETTGVIQVDVGGGVIVIETPFLMA